MLACIVKYHTTKILKMKKTAILTFALLFMTFIGQAQGLVDKDKFKVGFNAALPIGDAADFSSFSLGLDVQYHYGVSKVFDLGIATGFTNAFGKTETISDGTITIEADFDNVQFVPVAGAVRIFPTVRSRVSFGADLGYAVGISDGNDGGFYYRPTLAVNTGATTELTFSYTGISLDGGSWETLTLGVLFGF